MPQLRNEYGRTPRQQARLDEFEASFSLFRPTFKAEPFYSHKLKRMVSAEEMQRDWNRQRDAANQVRAVEGLPPFGVAVLD